MSKIVPLEGFGRVEKEYITVFEDSTLNFGIQQYTTEEELLAAKPKENTIGVVTTTPINQWVFDTQTPDTTWVGQLLNGFRGTADGSYQSDSNYTVCAITFKQTADKVKIILEDLGTVETYHMFYKDNVVFSVFPASEGTNIYDIPDGVDTVLVTTAGSFTTDMVDILYNCPEGTLWITHDIHSIVSFNALEGNNCLKVYPLTAKQYINNRWKDIVVKSYQNKEWVDWWNGELYEHGNEYQSITGGWRGGQVNSSYTTAGGILTANEDSLSFNNVSNGSFGIISNNLIDMSNYSNLHVLCKGYLQLSIANSYPTNSLLASITSANNYTNETTLTLPIAGFTKHYIALSSIGTGTSYIYKIWLD